MNLVFITRKMDRQDTRTSFIFRWIEKFAEKLDTLYVICQEKGDVAGIQKNIEVYSFGKDQGHGRVRQFFSLMFLVYKFSKRSRGVFAHMMPIYAIVSWLPAKLTRNKLVLWYTHKSVNTRLKIATTLVDRVFTASKESFRLKSPKVKVVGHGIDVEQFQTQTNSRAAGSKFKIVSIGRISRVKDYESLIKAIEILVNSDQQTDLQADIYGEPALREDLAYLQSLQQFVKSAGLEEYVFFRGGVSHDRVPQINAQSDLFVNMSQTGSLDKTVLEAAASGTIVLTSNEAFVESLQKISKLLTFERDNPKFLADRISKIKSLSGQDRGELQKVLQSWVIRDHNLDNLTDKILTEFK